MRAGAPKRKIFYDAVDLLTDDLPETKTQFDINMLDIDVIQPFDNHPFRLYEGERLEDMVKSIKMYGILTPVIVRKLGEHNYEMLSGHNRQNAARLAGIHEIPAIVKGNISDSDAYVYVIETNLMQRSFSDLLPSEKAAVLSEKYGKVCDQGRRNDILKELELLESGQSTSGQIGQKLQGRDALAKEYGLSSRVVARYLRINELIPPLKNLLDSDVISQAVAVELSYLPPNIQAWIFDASETLGFRINTNSAETFRRSAEVLTEQRIFEIGKDLADPQRHQPMYKSVKLPSNIYQKYFSGQKKDTVVEVIENALKAYFDK